MTEVINMMTKVKISFGVSLLVFLLGCVLAGTNLGKLGIVGFVGYSLTVAAVLAAIVTASAVYAFKKEEKEYGRKNS